ncbi:MAG: hypothetical protein IKA40_03195 [Clostridia bacterium]|nr:hypothetical protein [Clostridia bacterium]
MAQLTAAERLTKVKYALYGNATPTHNDEQLQIWIDEVIDDMIGAEVKQELAESTAAVGCIAVGVIDLWNYSSGNIKHSDYFYKRVVQLKLRGAKKNVSTE